MRKYFKKIKFYNIEKCSKILSEIRSKKFLIDKNTCSCFFENIIRKNNKVQNFHDPIYNFKAVKRKQEIRNIKKSSYL